MASLSRVVLPILDDEGIEQGRLTIASLPSQREQQTICVVQDNEPRNDDLEPVRLVEGTEYLYVLDLPKHERPLSTDHPEVFVADTEVGDRGRLRTGLHTGAMEVQFFAATQIVGKTSFEVQSTKLSYLDDYFWMLRDIADVCTDLLLDRFAPAMGRFSVDETQTAETLYQRFAFLQSILEGDEFHGAMRQILAAPHVTWEDVEEEAHYGRGLRPSSRISRSFGRPGPRAMALHTIVGDIDNVPQSMIVLRPMVSVDNEPNRFVRWLLREWLAFLGDVGQRLDQHHTSQGFARRGRREVKRCMVQLEAMLDDDVLRNVGELTAFPESNQVLQKREGYRTLLRLHWQFEAAARLYWPGMDPLYRAGQRNVAKLYEYWVYLQLGRIVARACGQSFDALRLIQRSTDGLTLRLRSGEETMVAGTLERFGRTLRVQSWFNKSFGMTTSGFDGSWTRPLRPDCSLRLEVVTKGSEPLVTWIHFDAKYRIEHLEETFGPDDLSTPDEPGPKRFRREDLLKMHAYKDAIRQSAGAYIVYPGRDTGKPFRQYHELLPGLGAFALRPAPDGESQGGDALATFMDHVFTHVALQASQRERAQYWTERAYAEAPRPAVFLAAPFLDQPPADVLVLLGFAKHAAHRHWILKKRMYNLRADANRGGAVGVQSQELSARLLLVFGPDQPSIDLYQITDAPRILTAQQLEAMEYPEPRGNLYFCLSLEPLPTDPSTAHWLTRARVEHVRMQTNPHSLLGAPVVVTWLDLCTDVPMVPT